MQWSAAALPAQQGGVGNLPEKRVLEGVGPTRCLERTDKLRSHQGVQMARERRLCQTRHVGQDIECELLAENAGRQQNAPDWSVV